MSGDTDLGGLETSGVEAAGTVTGGFGFGLTVYLLGTGSLLLVDGVTVVLLVTV